MSNRYESTVRIRSIDCNEGNGKSAVNNLVRNSLSNYIGTIPDFITKKRGSVNNISSKNTETIKPPVLWRMLHFYI
jgi:hypothetical protein